MTIYFIVLNEDSRQYFENLPFVLANGLDMDDVVGRLGMHIASIQEVDDSIAQAIVTNVTYVHNV